MAESTGIEWCDATFNPWWGCERVSPGCAHCYADTLARRRAPKLALWGEDHDFRFLSGGNWAKPLRWAKLARDGRLPDGSANKDGHRPRVFCASMADVFEERGELDTLRERLFALIADTPELDWLVLTKRPEFARDWLHARETGISPNGMTGYILVSQCRAFDGPLANMWLGVSIENARFTWRANVLRKIPAAVRFLSCEPLLGSLFKDPNQGRAGDSSHPMGETRAPAFEVRAATARQVARSDGEASPASEEDPAPKVGRRSRSSAPLDLTGIDWIIIGGESGAGARNCDVNWIREIIDHVAQVALGPLQPALFVKQLGARPIRSYDIDGHACSAPVFGIRDRKGGHIDEWPADLRIREFPATAAVLA